MQVCNKNNYTLDIPFYNVGWLADRVDHFCCDETGGKSGQIFHFNDNYNVVIGHTNETDLSYFDPDQNYSENGQCLARINPEVTFSRSDGSKEGFNYYALSFSALSFCWVIWSSISIR